MGRLLGGALRVGSPAHAQRVVQGQRLMQSSSDIFLGWAKGVRGNDLYVRQLRDAKIKAIHLLDTDGDHLITFWDLNDSRNQGAGKITDLNDNGRIDGGDGGLERASVRVATAKP